jgi:hypothetical protein
MAGALSLAAQRLNAATAGVTGSPTATETGVARAGGKGSGAVPLASPQEVTELLPTEFGDLTSLFGGEAAPSQQYEPMQTAVTIPGGSVRGALGGLKPDFSRIVSKATGSVPVTSTAATDVGGPGEVLQAPTAKVQTTPISVVVKNNVTKVRTFLKI